MPYIRDYPAILLKKEITRGRSFWPYISQTLALHLHNARLKRSFNIYRVLDEIALLEADPLSRPTGTKPAEKLSGPVMGRFWHKHWTDAQFIPANLNLQWWSGFAKKKGLVGLEVQKAYELAGVMPGAIPNEAQLHTMALQLSHVMVRDGYARRSGRGAITGEWLIYYKHGGQNYYLDIALHSEQKDEEALLSRLREGCEWEFPFAFA